MRFFRLAISSIMYLFWFLVLNYLVFIGVSFTFNIPMNDLYIAIVILAILNPITNILTGFYSNSIIRGIFALSASWLGISVFILILFGVYLIIGMFLPIPVEIAGKVIFVLAFIVGIYAVWNSTRMKIEELNISLNGIDNDIRAVQISDVHIGPVRNKKFVKELVDQILNLDPEIVFITGDLFDGAAKLPEDIIKDFERIKVPVLFIMGNHDFYQGIEDVQRYLETANIKIINNDLYEFKDLQVLGVPFSWKNGHLKEKLQNIELNKEKHSILLYHLPREFETTKEAGIDLQLSGHTHAGQFYPMNLFVKIMFPYLRGLYEKQGSFLYVSQGTGTLGPPMRLGSHCEITLINLKVK